MNSTHSSLLERLRHPADDAAWDRFVRLYAPLLFHWARGVGLHGPDAADLVQDVLIVLVRKLPDFHYDPRKSFRAWLRTVTLNKWRERLRRTRAEATEGAEALDSLACPDSMSVFEETEYRRELVRQALNVLRGEFPDRTWQAFWRIRRGRRGRRRRGRCPGMARRQRLRRQVARHGPASPGTRRIDGIKGRSHFFCKVAALARIFFIDN